MESKELLVALGERLNIELAFDRDGLCSLNVDGMSVVLSDLAEAYSIGICGEIGEPPPQQGLERLLTAMLNANHCFRGTGGATLSRDPESDRFCLCQTLDVRNLDVDAFFAALETFVNTQEAWRKLVADFRPGVLSGVAADAKCPPFGADGFLSV